MREYLKIGEVAELFGVVPATVRRWIKDGNLAFVHTPGGQIRVPADAFAVKWERFVNGDKDAGHDRVDTEM